VVLAGNVVNFTNATPHGAAYSTVNDLSVLNVGVRWW